MKILTPEQVAEIETVKRAAKSTRQAYQFMHHYADDLIATLRHERAEVERLREAVLKILPQFTAIGHVCRFCDSYESPGRDIEHKPDCIYAELKELKDE